MSTVSHVQSLSPYDQIEQYCTALISVLPSLFERTDTAFKRVHVQKLDEHGNARFFDKFDERLGKKVRTSVLSYILELKTGNLYNDDPVTTVAFKCFELVVAMPVYTVGVVIYQASITTLISATLIGQIAIISAGIFVQICRQFSISYSESKEWQDKCSLLPEVIGSGLFEIIKAPIFGLGAELVALYGIVKPYQARKYEALIENAWKKGAPYTEDVRHIPAHEDCLGYFLNYRPFYLAYCFQVRGNITDPRIRTLNQENIKFC